uniref:BTB/POZ domain-containing protein n=1 Tax=Arundo donax TaxID=35708 RepID=A0A0A9H4G8_ARUDO
MFPQWYRTRSIPSGSWAVKAKLIEVTGKALDAVGYGSVVLPASSRVHFLKTWLPYIQMTKLLLDGKTKDDETSPQMDSDLCQNIESTIVSMVLALPSDDQADILAEWMTKAEQFRYPDLTEAFELWCYRSKTAKRRLVGGLNGAGNPTVSL